MERIKFKEIIEGVDEPNDCIEVRWALCLYLNCGIVSSILLPSVPIKSHNIVERELFEVFR